MSHTFIEFKDKAIRVHETPLIFSFLFLLKVNESNFDSLFPQVKTHCFEQFERYNWGGINLELDSFLTTLEEQQQFLAMIDKTLDFINHNTIDGSIDITPITDFPVTLGMLSNYY